VVEEGESFNNILSHRSIAFLGYLKKNMLLEVEIMGALNILFKTYR